MGSVPSGGNQKNCVGKLEEGVAKMTVDLKNDSILKEITQNVEKVQLILKPSQSVNLERAKNQSKVKKVRDIRSLHTLKDVKIHDNQNHPYLPEGTDEIEDVSMVKKIIKELNPITKKKLASDRMLMNQQSKTQNVILMIPLGQIQSRNQIESRTKRFRVSRML